MVEEMGKTMSSKLYKKAAGLLATPQKSAFDDFIKWLGNYGSPAGRGAKLRRNLEDEAHLTGNEAFGDERALAVFLEKCGSTYRKTAADQDKADRYARVCNTHQGKGLKIPVSHLPGLLKRYSVSKKLFTALVEYVLGDTAKKDVDDGNLSFSEAFRLLAADWNPANLPDEKLGGGNHVFATFDASQTIPTDPIELLNALAHPVLLRTGQDVILFELEYATNSVTDHRFPTVADAELVHFFEPAQERAPVPRKPDTWYGWTKPLNGQPRQPEIVHKNASVRILNQSPKLIGELTI